jgi:hypothetical protein
MAMKITQEKPYDLDAYIQGEFKLVQENEKKYANKPPAMPPGFGPFPMGGGQRDPMGGPPPDTK